MRFFTLLSLYITAFLPTLAQSVSEYVDPRIGSEGEGRVVVGPSCPFGMVKPSPDCTSNYNSGWAPMPKQVDGFSQTHVSGTGGGPKYGNILIQPFCSGMDRISHPDLRTSEDMALGYYGTTYQHSGIRTEVTTAQRASFYRITYPHDSLQSLLIDAGWFLGEKDEPDARECQQFVGSEVQIISDTEVTGYTRIRGGWNNGRAYTVYFYLQTDRPFAFSKTWHVPARMFCTNPKVQISDAQAQPDCHEKTGALLRFTPTLQSWEKPYGIQSNTLNVKIGISFLSTLKAKANAEQQLSSWNFQTHRQACVAQWEELLSRIEVAPETDDVTRRMFYTGLYHTLLEPVDRTGENPLWIDYDASGRLVPYYDDFYAIWDTYRTSSPLITLLDPARQSDIVRSLINIGQRDGYMPDARSGNANGRTQGGSNAEIVLADAFLKGLGQSDSADKLKTDAAPIDWQEALQQMIKDATLPPGGNEEQEGRGGLREYLQLGYVPYGIDRSGNRTMEYAFCDYAIAQVAHGLGRQTLYQQYMQQSTYWRNLWRPDYEHAGTRGFIMPRSADGQWLDTLSVGHSHNLQPTFVYTPVTNESPWNKAWWGTVFYEATSWEYSLSVPHDVPGLIDICGGPQSFSQRLDTFFDQGFYNVNNEPSFLTPCLYHWIGRPDRTSDRVLRIIQQHFNDGPIGLPGNDDSGSMSSWLAFHMMGLYPNAGTTYYLLHTPILRTSTLHLANGRTFTIQANDLSPQNRYIVSARLNGHDYSLSYLQHSDLMQGGLLELQMGPQPSEWGITAPVSEVSMVSTTTSAPSQQVAITQPITQNSTLTADFDLRTQHRVFTIHFEPTEDNGLRLHWALPREGKVHRGSFTMSRESLQHGSQLCYEMPTDGKHVLCTSDQLFCMLSADALREVHEHGICRFCNTTLQLIGDAQAPLLHLQDSDEGYELWVNNNPELPLIVSMKGNPVEIDWNMK